MMVMFLFEFGVLGIQSAATAARYCISLIEAHIIRVQTAQRLAQRRQELLEARQNQRGDSANEDENSAVQDESTPEEEVDELDIEVPGWESKGQWILCLDLVAGMS
jgi:E3 ubiquitin-protein ligase synoviolin